LLDFLDSDSECKFAKDEPFGSMEDAALAHEPDARAELDDPDSEIEESVEEKVPSKWKASVKGLLCWDDDSDKEVVEEGVDPIKYAFTRTGLGQGDPDNNTNSREGFEGKDSEGIVGEPGADAPGLTDSGSD